ncbi:hypothetical protein BN946_scf184980.g33 [Trametes cinnabarina]|uniref:Uncharacterized protein n=1 Tax=Pycnoporus cinnabarinus TaxID=5643 RepID=A0A060SD98_PYCCI|nr:hypothetical protein BN946_scf184980.g33 [Trametes cinnabarina]
MCTPNHRTDVAARILHVPGNAHQSFRDFYEAQDALNDAIRNGEVRAVPRPPRQINPRPSSSSSRPPRRAQEDHREQHQHQHPSPSAPSGSSGTSAASRARRDALIAATLDEIERERQRGEVPSARAAGTGQTSTRADAVVCQAASAPFCTTRLRQDSIRASFAAGWLAPRHTDFASRPPAHTIGDNVTQPSSDASTSSSPPTQVTVLEHGSDSAPSLSTHQRAQSLPHTFQQSPELCVTGDREQHTVAGPSQKRHLTADGGDQIFPADYSTRALARFPVDRRSDISSPSTGVTRYFPRDYLTQARDETDDLQQSPPRIDIGSPASACYVTPPGSPYTQCAELPNDSPVSVAPTATPSSPSASSAPSRPQHSKIEKSYSDAAIQVDIQTRRQGCAQAAIQISGEKVYATTEAQMSPRPSTTESCTVIAKLPTSRVSFAKAFNTEKISGDAAFVARN